MMFLFRQLRQKAQQSAKRSGLVHVLTAVRAVAVASAILAVLFGSGYFKVESVLAAAGIYRPINYQGKLTSTGGVSITNGAYNMRFRIYAASTGGAPLWTEVWDSNTSRVTSTGGLFSIALGTHTTMTGSVDFNSDSLYLQVEFDPGNDGTYEEVFAPRRRFASVPYAHNARLFGGLSTTQFIRTDADNTASGTLTIKPNNSRKLGIDIISTGGSSATGALRLSTQGGPHILFGTGGSSYDTNLYRPLAGVLKTDGAFRVVGTFSGNVLHAEKELTTSGTLLAVGAAKFRSTLTVLGTTSGNILHAEKSLTTSGSLIFEGAASGSSLYVATSINGAGLADCDTAGTSKLLWDATTGRFSCGTDQTGGSAGTLAFSGGVLRLADARYVRKSGDTMTGALVLNPIGGSGALALRIVGTQSLTGSAIFQASRAAAKPLTIRGFAGQTANLTEWQDSAGTTIGIVTPNGSMALGYNSVDAGGYIPRPLGQTPIGLEIRTPDINGGVGINLLRSDGATGLVINHNGNGYQSVIKNIFAGSTLSLYASNSVGLTVGTTGLIGIGTTSPKTNLDVVGTISGTRLVISGNANVSGALLVLNGITSRGTVSGSILHASTQLRSSGTLVANGAARLGSTLTVLGSASGKTFHAEKTLSSSGTLVWEGAASGSSLYVATSINGAGLADCDTSGSSKLLWDSTTGRFSCGTDQTGSFGSGNVLTLGDARYLKRSGGTMTGQLVVDITSGTINTIGLKVINTFSGAIVQATQQLRSSGTLLTESGAFIDGNTLVVQAGTNRVGIGTAFPERDLDINPSTNATIRLGAWGAANGTSAGTALFGSNLYNDGSNYKILNTHSQLGYAAMYAGWSALGSSLAFTTYGGAAVTKDDTVTPAVRMYIHPNGNIGMGTSNPGSKLSVSGAVIFGANGNMAAAAADAGIALEIIGTVSGRVLRAQDSLVSSGTLLTESGAFIDGNTLVVQAGSNRVGIGTFVPKSTLDVLGSVSGSSLTVSGLSNCNTNNTVKADAQGNLYCATDEGGGGSSSKWTDGGAITYLTATSDDVAIGGSDASSPFYFNVAAKRLEVSNFSGATLRVQDLISSSGAMIITGNITSRGTISGSILHASTQLRSSGTLVVNGGTRLKSTLTVLGTTSGNILHAEKTLSSSGTLVFEGAASGSSLYIATSINGAGLADCDTSGSSKLLWDSTTGRFSCGTDQTGSFGSGNVLTLGDARYLKRSGGTMTGQLVVDITSGTINTIGLKVINTFSGAIVQATQQLRSSGTLITESGAIFDGGTLFVDAPGNRVGIGTTTPQGKLHVHAGNGFASQMYITTDTDIGSANDTSIVFTSDNNGVTNSAVIGQFNDGSLRLSGGSNIVTPGMVLADDNLIGMGTTTPGSKLALSGAMIINPNGNLGSGAADSGLALEIIGTVSGRILRAQNTLASSGTLVWEGAASGATLYVATSINGAGLADCDTAGTSKLLWDSTTGRFSCGTDQTGGSAGTAAFSGAVLRLADARYVRKSGDTMTGALAVQATISGYRLVISGNANITGALLVKGNITSRGTISGALVTQNGAGSNYFLGKVGIGTTSPVYELNVADTTGDAIAYVVGGDPSVTAGTGYIVLGSSRTNTAVGHVVKIASSPVAAGLADMLLYTQPSNGVSLERMRITNAGLIGIGTTTPGSKLSVSGAVIIGNAIGSAAVDSNVTLEIIGTASGRVLRAQNTLASSGSLVWEGAATGSTLYVATSINGAGLADCDTAGSSKLLWDSTTGRFSCGTDQGGAFGSGNVLTLGDARYVRKSGDTMTGSLVVRATLSGTRLVISGNANITGALLVKGNITSRGTISGALITQNGGGNNYFLGNVGIGDTSPGAKLVVTETAASTYPAYISASHVGTAISNTIGPIIANTDSTTGNWAGLLFSDAIGGSASALMGVKFTDHTNNYGDFAIATRSAAGFTEKMRILSTGNVGIGKSAPATALDVVGTISGSLVTQNGSGSNYFMGNVGIGKTTPLSALDVRGSTDSTWVNGGSSYGLVTLGTGGSGGSLWVNTPSLNGIFHSGLAVNGSYASQTSTVNIAAYGVKSAGGYGSELTFSTTNNNLLSEAMIIEKTGDIGIDTSTPGSKLSVSGAAIIGSAIGSAAADTNITLEIIGTASGRVLRAQNTLASSGSLVWEGAATGSTLYVATSINGAGLADCDTAGTSKLLWDATTGRFSCGSDQGGAAAPEVGTASYSGATLRLADARYVRKAGDTMTGSLAVQATLSGYRLVISGNANVTGALLVRGNITSRATISGALITQNGAGSNYFMGNLGIGTASPSTKLTIHEAAAATAAYMLATNATNTTGLRVGVQGNGDAQMATVGAYGLSLMTNSIARITMDSAGLVGIGTSTPGSKLSLSGAMIIGSGITSAAADSNVTLEIIGTASGRVIRAQNTLASSGSLVWEGAATGSTLYVATSINGAGLADCDTAGTSKLLWDATTGRFSCGSDQGGAAAPEVGTLSYSGATLRLADARYVRKAGDTMTGALLVKANLSGSRLIISGNANVSGALLTVGNISTRGTFTGSALTIMNGASYLMGNVAIGKTTVANNSKLDVVGSISGRSLVISNNGSFSGALMVRGNVTTRGTYSGAALNIQSGAASYILGNLALGKTAVANNSKLDVVGAISGRNLVISSNGTFSGALMVRGNVTTRGTYSGAALNIQGGAASYILGNLALGKTSVANNSKLDVVGIISGTTLVISNNGTFSGAVIIVRNLTVRGTYSGNIIHAEKMIASSGQLMVRQQGAVTMGSGALTVINNTRYGTGAYIGSSGSILALNQLNTSSGARSPHILFGYRGKFDVSLSRTSSGGLTVFAQSGNLLTLHSESKSGSTMATNPFRIISDVATSFGSDENLVYRIRNDGAVFSDGAYSSSGADYAEWFYSKDKLLPGDVVCIDILQNNAVTKCSRSGDPNLMGIVSTNPAFIGNNIAGADGVPVPHYYLIGLIGQVPAHVSLENGAIRPGDSLTSSSIPGVARRASAGESTVGVALEAYNGTQPKNVINVLISRRNQSLTVETLEQKVLDSIASMNIGDEIARMVSAASENVQLDDQITQALQEQLQSLDLEGQVVSIINNRYSGSLISFESLNPLHTSVSALTQTSSVLASRLSVTETELVNISTRLSILQTTLSGALRSAESIHAAAGSFDTLSGKTLTISGTTVLSGPVTAGVFSISGSTVQIGSLTASGALRIVGNVTVSGLAEFLGIVRIKGELVLSNKQAGYATIPLSGTSVTVRFDSGMVATPIVTATPDVPVLYAVSKVTATGFTIRISPAATEKITFAFIAIAVEGPRTTNGTGSIATLTPFPVNALGQPVSSDIFWNSCIQGHPLTLSGGEIVSCARYHAEYEWQHPDLGVSFTYRPNNDPPLLLLPKGYVATPITSPDPAPVPEPQPEPESSSSSSSSSAPAEEEPLPEPEPEPESSSSSSSSSSAPAEEPVTEPEPETEPTPEPEPQSETPAPTVGE